MDEHRVAEQGVAACRWGVRVLRDRSRCRKHRRAQDRDRYSEDFPHYELLTGLNSIPGHCLTALMNLSKNHPKISQWRLGRLARAALSACLTPAAFDREC